MKKLNRMNEFVSFGSSKASGNCEPGSEEFSVAILRLSAMNGIPGFEHFEHNACALFENVTMSIAHVESLMTEARSARRQQCAHDCHEDCYTCQGGEHRHDCMVYRERIRPLIGESRSFWICEHFESCACCQCETDEERDGCTCCEHDCPNDCLTCENHSQGEHDCHDGYSDCQHDCEEAECFDNLEAKEEAYQILLNYESIEWPRAKQFSATMARFHSAHVAPEQSAWLTSQFRFADQWYDPQHRVNSILRSDGHANVAQSSNLPRLISNLNEAISTRTMHTMQHGYIVADTLARKQAITFLLTGQAFGYLTREAPLVTYSLRATMRNISLVERLTNSDYEVRLEAIQHALASDTYSNMASNVLWTINQYHLAEITTWLSDFCFNIQNASAIVHGVSNNLVPREHVPLQTIINTYRTHMGMYCGTTTDESNRAHKLFNAVLALRSPQPTQYPFVFIVEYLIANLHSNPGVMRDIPSIINSSEFLLAFKNFAGIDTRDQFTKQCDMLLEMDPRHQNKVNNMIQARLAATNAMLG